MRDVETGAGELGEDDVAIDRDDLRCSRNALKPESRGPVALVHDAFGMKLRRLAMLDDGHVENSRIFHGAPHDVHVANGKAVIGGASKGARSESPRARGDL